MDLRPQTDSKGKKQPARANRRRPKEQEHSDNVPDERTRTRRDKAPVTARPFQIRGRFLTAIALRMEGGPLAETIPNPLPRPVRLARPICSGNLRYNYAAKCF